MFVDSGRQYDLSLHLRGQGQADGLWHPGHHLLNDNTYAEAILGGRPDHEMASGAGVGHHGARW